MGRSTALSLRQLEDFQRQLPSGCIAARPEKSPTIFGKTLVTKDALEASLGKTTWRVWWHAERVCSPETGAYFEGRARAAAELGISERSVKKSLTRLLKAGLMTVGVRRKLSTGHWFLPKKILGHFAQMPGAKAMVLVPATTALWLKRPDGRGGARAGAGRPAGSRNKKISNRGPPTLPTKSNGGPPKSNRGPSNNTSSNTTTSLTPYGVSAAVSAAPCQGAQVTSPPAAVSAPPPTGFNPPTPGVQRVSGEIGLGLIGNMKAGGGPPPPGQGGVPRYPGPTLLLPCHIPGPRPIPEDLSEEDAVEWVLKAYRGAVEARSKKKCWVFMRKGEARKSKYWPMLVDAVRTLREMEWAPASWMLWASGLWYERNKKPPTLKFIFNANFMREQANWFEHELAGYQATRIVYNDIAKAILARYQTMIADLRNSGAESPEAVRYVVEKHWPNGLYEKALARANARTREDQAIVNQRLMRGEFLW